ncbi:hypothetical protein V8D89_006132 [Ganoderma adspersum]
MRFALATVLAAAALVAARPPCFHTKPSTCHVDARDGGHHTIEVPAAKAAVGSPFSFKFSDTTRNPGDTSYLQLGFWNLTYRGDLGRVDFSTDDHTTATATVSVPHQFATDGYALVVQEIDNGNQIYMGDVGVFFTR